MVSSKSVSELLFEFSNSSRLDILFLLLNNSEKASQIAKRVDQTIQETSRHLQRLIKVHLVIRDTDGTYLLSPLGELLMEYVSQIDFLAKNAEFLVNHDLSCISRQFRYGLGLIKDYQISPHVMDSFRQTVDLIKHAEEFIWIHSDQILSSSVPHLQKAIERGLDVRVILPRALEQDEAHLRIHRENTDSEKYNRFSNSVTMAIVLSEKKAQLAFPGLDGTIDYRGVSFTNIDAIKWCMELYQHFWEQARI